MNKDLARKVYDHLLKFPNHLFPPPKKDGSELNFFEIPYPVMDEEGEFMLHFKGFGEPIEVIAKRAGLDKSKALELVDSLTQKWWILRKGSREDGLYWLNYAHAEWWMPFVTSKERAEEAHRIHMPDSAEPGTTSSVTPTEKPIGTEEHEDLHHLRVIPVERSLSFDTQILPTDFVSCLIETAGDELSVAECFCRKWKAALGEPCKKEAPLEQCLFLPPFAATAIEAGVARKITKKEAYEIIGRAREYGLVHQSYNSAHPRAICSCCDCCCGTLHLRHFSTPSNFFSQINPELCKGSMDCVKQCPAKAICYDKVKETAMVDIEKCYGCGLCVENCPNQAPVLKRREKCVMIPEREDEMGEIRARQGHGSRELFIGFSKGR